MTTMSGLSGRAVFPAMVLFVVSGCSLPEGFLSEKPEIAAVPEQRIELDPIPRNRFILQDESQQLIGELQVVRANHEDTFVDIARSYGLGFDELVAANPDVDPWLPGDGTQIILPTRHILPDAPREGVVLNIAAKRLFYFPGPDADGQIVVWTYPIGIGREGWSTPTGVTTIVSRARDPIWYVPLSIRQEYAAAGNPISRRVPPGPDNPLGRYVLGLGMPGYLIHGTNKPSGVGMRVSHGCVRLFPEDIEHLYGEVGPGIAVRIVDEPFLFGWDNGDLYFEAHAPLDEREEPWSELVNKKLSGVLAKQPDMDRPDTLHASSQEIAEAENGFPVSVVASRSDVQATIEQARQVENIVIYEWMADESSSQQELLFRP